MPDVVIVNSGEQAPAETPTTETTESEAERWLQLGRELEGLRQEVSQLREQRFEEASLRESITNLTERLNSLETRLVTLETETELIEEDEDEDEPPIVEMEVTTETVTEEMTPPKRSFLKTFLLGSERNGE